MPETLTLSHGERLMICRKRAGLNSTEMARRLRVSANTLRSWEADRTRPKYLEVLAWADVCNVAAELLDPDIRNRCSDPAAGDSVQVAS
jgi:transcriptional regulator with XRE-family HTH domain